MRGTFRFILIAGLVAASAFPSFASPRLGIAADAYPVFAQVRSDDLGWRPVAGNPSRDEVVAQATFPLNAILQNIARMYPGKHLEAEGPYEQGGRRVYRIKWLTNDGRVIVFLADAETGQIISQRGG